MKELLNNLKIEKKDLSILVHKFEDFKKTEHGRKLIEDSTEAWGRLGFLEGLSQEDKEKCAVAMEQAATYFLSDESASELYKNYPQIETIIFPIIRRIITGSIFSEANKIDDGKFEFSKLIKYLKMIDYKSLEKVMTDKKEALALESIDIEAEVCAMLSEILISKFNNDDISLEEACEEIKGIIEKKQ